MTAEHFRVHPDGVRELVQDFRTAAEEIDGRIAGFTARVAHAGTAFGLLGACTGVTTKYTEMVAHTSEGLRELARLLDHSGAGLHRSAGNYDAVEAHTTKTLGG